MSYQGPNTSPRGGEPTVAGEGLGNLSSITRRPMFLLALKQKAFVALYYVLYYVTTAVALVLAIRVSGGNDLALLAIAVGLTAAQFLLALGATGVERASRRSAGGPGAAS